MSKFTKLILSVTVITSLLFMVSCGGGSAKKNKVKLSEKGNLLTSVTWKYDTNASLKGGTDKVKDSTGVTADVELKKDVKAIADFAAEKLSLYVDDNGKLSYSRKYGEGIFSTKTLGFWNFDNGEAELVMRDWDKSAGKEKPAKTYTIVELTKERLILKDKSDGKEYYYSPK